jgi:hypothetical protein
VHAYTDPETLNHLRVSAKSLCATDTRTLQFSSAYMVSLKRPDILKLCGMTVDMFESMDVALQVADEKITQNRSLFPNTEDLYPNIISKVSPIANQYWYIHSEGPHCRHACF